MALTIALSGSYPLPDGSNQLPSLAYLEDVLENLVITGITRDNMGTSSKSITVSASSPSSPSTGEHWLDTATGGKGSLLSYWDGTQWVPYLTVGSTQPSHTEWQGKWFDTTNSILREYKTLDGITGWHGTDPGLILMRNNSGGAITRGMVAVRDTSGLAVYEASTTTTVKSMDVIGVWMDEPAAGSNGLVALIGSGAVVGVLVDDGEADGAVAKGDGLVTYSVAGEARTCGPLTGGAFVAADHGREIGVPLGCFAEALSTKDGNNVVRARLLDQLGQGRRVWTARGSPIDATAVADDTWQEYTYSDATLTGKRKPILGVYLSIDATFSSGTGSVDSSYQFSANRNANIVVNCAGIGPDADEQSRPLHDVFILTSNGDSESYAGLGEKYQFKYTLGTADAFDTGNIYTHGYVY